ncbi:MAG: DoxX family protein, partial [Pseudonocardiaceae bacterium]
MLLRRIARPLLAGIFIYGGIGALRDPESHAQAAKPVLDTMVDLAPIERAPNATTVVKVDAGVKIGAGVLLALGKAPRLASTALAASLIPTTLAGHRYWEIEDPHERSDQLIHFLKNLGLLGGLVIAAADTAGKPSLAWRGRHAGRVAAAASQRKLAKMTART